MRLRCAIHMTGYRTDSSPDTTVAREPDSLPFSLIKALSRKREHPSRIQIMPNTHFEHATLIPVPLLSILSLTVSPLSVSIFLAFNTEKITVASFSPLE